MRIKALTQLPVSAYQKYVSKEYNGVRGSQCAFHPSCSAFAKEEIAEQGPAGIKEAFYRLRRCTNGTSSERLSTFLLHAAHCPPNREDEFFSFDDPLVRSHWRTFRSRLEENRDLLAGDGPERGAAGLTEAMTEFFGKVHMSVHGELKPGAKPRFHLEMKRQAQAVERADRGLLGNSLRTAAGVAMGGLGAGLGALGAGLGAALVGLREGFTAGSGGLPLFRKKVEERHGTGSLSGSEPFLDRLDDLSGVLERRLPGRLLGTAIGGAIGGLTGLVAGVTGGAAFGLKTGWDMGKTLGVNWSDEKLKTRFSSVGTVIAQPAKEKPPAEEPPEMNPQRVQLLSRLMSQVPPHLAPKSAPARVGESWSIAGLLDGTDPALERHEVGKIAHFRDKAPDGVETALHLRRGPGLAERAAPWLLAVTTPLALAASPGAGLIAGIGLWAGLEQALERREKREEAVLGTSQPVWSGSREFEGASVTRLDRDSSAMNARELSAFLEDNLAPEGDNNVLLLSGHGKGALGVGGYRPQTVAGALSRSDRQVELGVLEGCQTATLEGLTPLADGVRYALASQLDMDGMGLPWHHLLGHLPNMGENPREFATSTVELVGGLETVPSLSLIDLKALPALRDSLEELSATLLKEGHAEQAGAAARGAVHTEPEGLARLARPRRLDLGRFLNLLGDRTLSAGSAEAVRECRRSLSQAVIAGKSDRPLGGLSVEIPSPIHRRGYIEKTGLENWARLTKNSSQLLSPLPQKLNHVPVAL